jgi:hypothetical protein
MENPGRVRRDAVSLEEWFPTFRSIVLPSHSRPRDPLMWAIRAFETSGFRSVILPSHSRTRDPLMWAIRAFEPSGFRSIVLPSHSRPRDPLMWATRAFETSGTIYSMTQRYSLIKLPLLLRCRKVSIDPHYIFRCVRVNKLLKQFVPSLVGSVSLDVVYKHPE